MPPLTLNPKNTLISASLLLLVLVMFFGLLPVLVKDKLPALIGQATGKPTTLAAAQINLFPLSLRLQGLAVNSDNGQALAAIGSFYLEIDVLASISQLALVINKLSLDKAFVRLSKKPDGSLDVVGLTDQPADKPTAGHKPFPLTITQLSLTDTKLVYEDEPQKTTATIYPLQLEIKDFSTDAMPPAEFKLSLDLDGGGHADWIGNLGLKPLHSAGRIKLAQLDLKKLLALGQITGIQGLGQAELDYTADYADDSFKLVLNTAKLGIKDFQYRQDEVSATATELAHETRLVLSFQHQQLAIQAEKAKITAQQLATMAPVSTKTALLSATGAYQLSYANKHLDFNLKAAAIDAKALQLAQPEQTQALAEIPALAVSGIDFNLGKRQINIASIAANDADVNAKLYKDGTFNFQALLPKPAVASASAETDTKPSPWQIQADKLSLNNGGLSFTDESLATPTTTNFKPIDLTLAGYNNQAGTRLPINLGIGINKSGTIKLSGDGSLSPPAAKLDLNVENVDLAKFQNYFAQFIHLDVIDGRLNINGKLALALEKQLDLTFNGNTSIADFLTRDQRIHKDFIKWLNLSLSDIHIDTLANRYTADELAITRPYTRVTIRKDKTVNYSNLLVTDTVAPQTKPETTKPPSSPLYFKLAKIRITDASTNFSDLSLILPFSAYIQDMEGGANGLSSETNAKVNVNLKGKAYDLSSVDITGELSPYLGDYNFKVNFNGLPMPLVSPYMVQFAGYKVEKGKMSLELNYKVADKKLTANNKFLIDQFELGEKVDNPDAVSIPLKLAVALLKDANGKIKFDFPISGSLENPQFSISAIVADALGNAITKIISSPFAALASLSGGEEDFSTVTFTAGNAELSEPQKTKLNAIAKSLLERPALTIGIKGTAYERQDWPAISDDALYDQLKMRRADEINNTSEIKIRPEYVKLSDEEYRRILADMFIEKFPALTEKSFFGTPQLKAPQTGDFYAIAKQKLMEVINPEQERLKELSVFRARAIAKYIVQNGKVPQERVYILDTVVDKEKDEKDIPSLLSLKAD